MNVKSKQTVLHDVQLEAYHLRYRLMLDHVASRIVPVFPANLNYEDLNNGVLDSSVTQGTELSALRTVLITLD